MDKVHKISIYFILASMTGGGAEKNAVILLKHLDRSKFRLKLVLFNKMGEYLSEIPRDVEIVDFKKRNKWDFLRIILLLRRIVRKERPDILFSSLHYTNIITLLARIFTGNKCRIVLSEHSSPGKYLPDERYKILKWLLMCLTYKKSSKIVAVSRGLKKDLSRRLHLHEDSIVVINNPIDVERIKQLSQERQECPFLSQNCSVFSIISIGRLSKEKNQELLIKAFAGVAKKIKTQLFILGHGRLKNKLMELVDNLDLNESVYFADFQKNPFVWIKRSDLLVLSSNWEGFGNVIVEAMACGTPVISTDCPSGPREIIENNENGLLIPVNDINAMSEAILRLAKDEVFRNRIKENATNSIDKFDVKNVIKEYEKVFYEFGSSKVA